VVGSLLEVAQQALVTKDVRPGTRRQYLISLKPFNDLDPDTLTVSHLNEILLGMTNQNTRRKCIIALRALVDHPAVKALRVPAAIPRDYDLPEESTLRLALMTCPHETRLLLAMYGGLRLGELCAVTGENVKGRWLTVERQIDETTRRVMPTKSAAGRVPLPPWLAERVQDLSGHVSPKAVRKALLNAGNRVGIRLNPHQLRVWYCNMLIEQGHPPHVVQKLMRHANVKVTFTHYAKAAAGDLERAVEGLGGF
jgi:integrase